MTERSGGMAIPSTSLLDEPCGVAGCGSRLRPHEGRYLMLRSERGVCERPAHVCEGWNC